jgi:membrane protein CcdC involved in cytochrome C biogenesis
LRFKYQSLWSYDTSKHNDPGTVSTVDVSIEFEALENVEDISAYCILIPDRIIEYVPLSRKVEKNLYKCQT